jgi:hypothetical protein
VTVAVGRELAQPPDFGLGQLGETGHLGDGVAQLDQAGHRGHHVRLGRRTACQRGLEVGDVFQLGGLAPAAALQLLGQSCPRYASGLRR